MYVRRVGALYHPARTKWPETPQLTLSPNGCELVLFYDRPKAAETRAVKSDPAQFALVDTEHVAIFCYRFGTLPWADFPYQAWREREEIRGVPAGAQGEGLLITVILVDASTGIVKAIRATTWPGEFADAVRATVRRQLDQPADDNAAAAALETLYENSTEDLVARASARC
jgi:hypothetical protein